MPGTVDSDHDLDVVQACSLMTASAQGWPGTASGRPRSVHMARHRIPQRLGTLGAGTALRYVRR